MKILGTRIIREKTYKHLLKFKSKVEEILKKGLPVVSEKVLLKKNIVLSKGLVLVNSSIINSNIKYKSKVGVNAFYRAVLFNNVFSK